MHSSAHCRCPHELVSGQIQTRCGTVRKVPALPDVSKNDAQGVALIPVQGARDLIHQDG